MIKKLVLVFIAVFAINSYGQEGTSSPYSFYGIGSLKFKGTVENRSMGGLSIYTEGSNVIYKNASSVSIGGFYIPEYNSFTSFLKRAVYRAGLHFENKGLKIENESINEFGISFGVGLPVGSFSRMPT